MLAPPRFSQRPIRSHNSCTPQETPHSMKAKFRRGKRWVTPPKKRALAKASLLAAKLPMWLNMYVVGDWRRATPIDGEWTETATPSSTQRAHTGS